MKGPLLIGSMTIARFTKETLRLLLEVSSKQKRLIWPQKKAKAIGLGLGFNFVIKETYKSRNGGRFACSSFRNSDQTTTTIRSVRQADRVFSGTGCKAKFTLTRVAGGFQINAPIKCNNGFGFVRATKRFEIIPARIMVIQLKRFDFGRYGDVKNERFVKFHFLWKSLIRTVKMIFI
jgi:hypothetical protein